MEQQFILKTTAHWKALSHPLRSSILSLLTEHSLTNEELADTLGVESGKLYFHTRQLFEAGLIHIVETRAKGPITEKVYQAVARNFVSNGLPDAREGDAPPFDAMVAGLLAMYRQAWRDHGSWNGKAHHGFHFLHRVPTERMAEFVTRLKALAEEFEEIRTDDPDATEYSMGILLHALPPGKPRKK
jgi:DNA-binding transcriptional ArsR family regulator